MNGPSAAAGASFGGRRYTEPFQPSRRFRAFRGGPAVPSPRAFRRRGDRLAAGHDYEVNLKAELEIMGLHEKLDVIRSRHLEELLRAQQEQLGLLTQLIGANGKAGFIVPLVRYFYRSRPYRSPRSPATAGP